MTIASALVALNTDIQNARTAITNKGGTVTANGGSSQLATDIATIPSGDTSDIEEALHNINSGGATTRYIAWTVATNTILTNTTYWAYTFSSSITNGETVYQLNNLSYNQIGTLSVTNEGEYNLIPLSQSQSQQITPFQYVTPKENASITYKVSEWSVSGGGSVYTSSEPINGSGFWLNYNGTSLSDFITGYYYYTDGQKHYSKNATTGDLIEITKVGG